MFSAEPNKPNDNMLIASHRRFVAAGSIPTRREGRIRGVPTLLLTTMAAFLLSSLYQVQFFGYNLSGWLWVGILIVAVVALALNPTRVSFPYLLWLPWVIYSASRIQDWSLLGAQSTVQILLPVLVAASASTVTFSTEFFESLDRWMRYSFIGVVFLFVFVALPWALSDVSNSGWITSGIISLFFQSYFLCSYLLSGYRKPDLICAVIAGCIPLTLTLRGPILGACALWTFVLAPLPLWRRGIISIGVIVLGLLVFYSPRVQTKMFYTGEGSLLDLRTDNPNLNTSGRSSMVASLEQGLDDSVWIGHGANSAGQVVLGAGAPTHELHNDWLRIRYNSGLVGVVIFAASVVAGVVHLLWSARGASHQSKFLACTGATCFIPFVIVMFTDNLIVYCYNYTVPHFVLIGYAYASLRDSVEKGVIVPPPALFNQRNMGRLRLVSGSRHISNALSKRIGRVGQASVRIP